MDVPNAVGMLAQQPWRITVGVGDMTSVQAQPHQVPIGVGEKTTDLFIGLDVALGMGIEHQPHAGLVAEHAREVVGTIDERTPLVAVQLGQFDLTAVVEIPVHRRQEDDVLGALRARQPCNLEHPRFD